MRERQSPGSGQGAEPEKPGNSTLARQAVCGIKRKGNARLHGAGVNADACFSQAAERLGTSQAPLGNHVGRLAVELQPELHRTIRFRALHPSPRHMLGRKAGALQHFTAGLAQIPQMKRCMAPEKNGSQQDGKLEVVHNKIYQGRCVGCPT